MKLLIINGPNLNILGIREPEIYGTKSYYELSQELKLYANEFHIELIIKQTNYEGKIIDLIHHAYFKRFDGIIINPGALTHYSYAIHDAISSVNVPVVEVHLSDLTTRESFRQKSVISDVCCKTIMGKSYEGYFEAIDYFMKGDSNNVKSSTNW